MLIKDHIYVRQLEHRLLNENYSGTMLNKDHIYVRQLEHRLLMKITLGLCLLKTIFMSDS